MATETIRTKAALIQALEGQHGQVCDLHAILKDWPQAESPDLNELRKDVILRLRSLFPPGQRLTQLERADMAFFGAAWWPYADFERLRIATYLAIWLFVWDDETDSQEFSTVSLNVEQSHEFGTVTRDYIRQCLGYRKEQAHITPSNPLIYSFREVGDAVVQSCSLEERECLLRELEFFLEMSSEEQRVQQCAELSSVDGFQRRRMGTSAVGACLAMTEYCYKMRLPYTTKQDSIMTNIWDETNIIVSTVNDILSVSKELAQGQVETLLPLLFLKHGDVQIAIDKAIEILQSSVKRFDQAADQLISKYSGDEATLKQLQLFIVGCRHACTATLNWSLRSSRYNLQLESVNGTATLNF